MRLYVIRHGESENNAKGLFTGWIDAALTEKGVSDAASLRSFLSKIPFDKIYSSDLSRAKLTAETAIPGCVYETTPLLREMNVGKLGGQNSTECMTESNSIYAADIINRNFVPFGGENTDMVVDRARKFLKIVENSGYENIAAFSHGGWMSNILKLVIGPYERYTINCPNCTVAVFEFSDNKWKLRSWIDPQFLNL